MNETIETFTERVGKINNQRELAKLMAAETAGGKRRPFLAALERRQSARAKEIKDAQRRSAVRPPRAPAAAARAGKAPGQNGLPVKQDAFRKEGAKPLAEVYMDAAGELELSIGWGDDRSILRTPEPIEGVSVLPKNGNLVTSTDLELDTAGMQGSIEVTHAYLLAGGKPIGVCELAAPLGMQPNQKSAFRAGSLMFRS